jgi:Peptidase inhibitor family I36
MIRSALIRKIIIGVTPGIAVAMLAVGGATAAQASTQSVSHGAIAATAATAATPMSDIADCKAADPTRSYICWWVGANMTGKMHPVRDAISNWTTQKEASCAGGTWNDCASTLYNDNASYGAFFFYSANDSGSNFCMTPGTYLGNLTQYDYAGSTIPINDTISSNSWDTDGCVTS